ncbi:MAG: hypothetical protein JJE25_04040 [Bacteroidia bacterium]|nr:hypothetical protein [Bacteroidia bacterium]
MKKAIFLVSVCFLFIHFNAKSQGCSDAGFCTMGALKPQSEGDTAFRHNAKLSFSFGKGEQGTSIIQIIPEIEMSFFENNFVQFKVPFISVTGNLGSNSNAGDISLSITQAVKKNETTKLSFTLGTKIATGNSSDHIGQQKLPLPMPYQTSLGTNDIILGASLQHKEWNFAIGFQGILSNNNKNNFLSDAWTSDAVSTYAIKYFESRLLERGNDALLRIERSFTIKRVNLSAGLLGIYHLQEASIVDDLGSRIAVKNSEGLTLNVNGNANYNFSRRTGINFTCGFPIIVRKVRPDGLTRKIVLTAGFNFLF